MALRPFEETAKQIRRGFFLIELAEKLAAVAQAVDATGKQGELNIKLTIKKISRVGAMEISDKITTKIPTEPAETTMVFVTPEGNLLTQDPRQQSLDLEQVKIKGADENLEKDKSLKLVQGA